MPASASTRVQAAPSRGSSLPCATTLGPERRHARRPGARRPAQAARRTASPHVRFAGPARHARRMRRGRSPARPRHSAGESRPPAARPLARRAARVSQRCASPRRTRVALLSPGSPPWLELCQPRRHRVGCASRRAPTATQPAGSSSGSKLRKAQSNLEPPKRRAAARLPLNETPVRNASSSDALGSHWFLGSADHDHADAVGDLDADPIAHAARAPRFISMPVIPSMKFPTMYRGSPTSRSG